MRTTISFERRPMLLFALTPAIMFLILATTPAANATVIINTSLQFQSLTITPSSGVAVITYVDASIFGDVANSLGDESGFNQFGTNINVSATVPWASLTGSAYSSPFTGSLSSNVQIPGGVAGTTSTLYEAFGGFYLQINQATGPVSVQFSAVAPYTQSLLTDSYGRRASEDLSMFACILNEGSCTDVVFFAGSFPVIEGSSSFFASGIFNVSNQLTLTAGQSYPVGMDIFELSNTTNASTTPEPTSLMLLGSGVLGLARVIPRQLRRQRQAMSRQPE